MQYFYNGEKGMGEKEQRKKQKTNQGFSKVVEKHSGKRKTEKYLRKGDFLGKKCEGSMEE